MQQAGNCTITAVCRSNYEAVKANGIEIQTVAWGEGPHVFRPDHGQFTLIYMLLILNKSQQTLG
jgi:hypothetical protein